MTGFCCKRSYKVHCKVWNTASLHLSSIVSLNLADPGKLSDPEIQPPIKCSICYLYFLYSLFCCLPAKNNTLWERLSCFKLFTADYHRFLCGSMVIGSTCFTAHLLPVQLIEFVTLTLASNSTCSLEQLLANEHQEQSALRLTSFCTHSWCSASEVWAVSEQTTTSHTTKQLKLTAETFLRAVTDFWP